MVGHTAQLKPLAIWKRQALGPTAWDAVQRGVDVFLIALTAPVWAPLLLLTVALKLLFDGRPVWFGHERLGLGGKPFVMYKIRTTPREFHPGAEDWSDEDFPPRTRFGQWLRRFDIDELPQLWNVLKGEMSLVGPRPEMPVHAERFGCRHPEFVQRVIVRPGLTGLAQIRGWRGNTSIRHRLESDLEYLERRGPGLYGNILAKTVVVEARRARGQLGPCGQVISHQPD
jgi:lipopolysaccharide/colanic/teichoic acid biosynthesis glycosyltransferase